MWASTSAERNENFIKWSRDWCFCSIHKIFQFQPKYSKQQRETKGSRKLYFRLSNNLSTKEQATQNIKPLQRLNTHKGIIKQPSRANASLHLERSTRTNSCALRLSPLTAPSISQTPKQSAAELKKKVTPEEQEQHPTQHCDKNNTQHN